MNNSDIKARKLIGSIFDEELEHLEKNPPTDPWKDIDRDPIKDLKTFIDTVEGMQNDQ